MESANPRLTSLTFGSYSNNNLQEALSILDKVSYPNTARFRRKLRVSTREGEISTVTAVINNFAGVSLQLRDIGSSVNNLEDVCQRMHAQVHASSAELMPILDEANSHAKHKQETLAKDLLFDAFCRHFLISEDEISTLTSSIEPVTVEYFNALEKVQKIHGDCQLLLTGESQRAGLDIMDQMSKFLQEAFQKLYRWILREFKQLSLDSPRMNSLVRHGLFVLSEKPTLFESCLASFSEARQASIHQAFHDALTGASRGLISGASKPIELYAHDPLRYIGDLLAWCHSAVVGEKEALDVMFAPKYEEKPSTPQTPISRSFIHQHDAQFSQTLNSLVDKNISVICNPLKVKVSQIISVQQSSALCYQIYNLIGFYIITLRKVTLPDSQLLVSVRELEALALQQFKNNIKDHIRSIHADAPSMLDGCAVPDFLLEALAELRLIVTSYNSALGPHGNEEQNLDSIFDIALDPYLQNCEKLAKNMMAPQGYIFLLNCLNSVKETLGSFDFTMHKLSLLNDKIASHADKLVSYIHDLFLTKSKMSELLQYFSADNKLILDSAIGPKLIINVAEALDEYLPLALIDARATLYSLSSPGTVGDVLKRSADAFINDFARVSIALQEVRGLNGHEWIWPRTVNELRILLT